MKAVSVLFAAAALVTGFISAWYWYKSSVVKITPQIDHRTGGAMPGPVRRWLGGIIAAAETAAQLNKKAALWTAATILFGSLGNFLGLIGPD